MTGVDLTVDLWEAYPRRVPDLLAEQFDDELVLCDPMREEVLLLNEMGAAVWELCDGRHSVRDIVAEIVEHLHVGQEQVRQDVISFLIDVRGKGFLQVDKKPVPAEK